MICKRCNVEMIVGQAIESDMYNSIRCFPRILINAETLKLIKCLKCPSCGHSDDLK